MADIWADERRTDDQKAYDLGAREAAVESLLSSIPGEAIGREGLIETPKRVAKMYEELFAGYEMDYHKILSKQFDVGKGNPSTIEVRDIQFYSMCEHHIMPFCGTVSVVYQAKMGGKVVGLSKVARLVECFARRLQIQERLGKQIACAIGECLVPEWCEVKIEAEHTCMTARGINKPGSKTVTTYRWTSDDDKPF